MRYSTELGVMLHQVSTEVRKTDHEALRRHARKEGKTVQTIVREWIQPMLDQIIQAEEEPTPTHPIPLPPRSWPQRRKRSLRGS